MTLPETMPDLLDIGANLTHDSFDEDRDAVIARAREHGVRRVVVTGSTEQGSIDAVNLAESYPGCLFATAGVHPHHASDYQQSVGETIRDLSVREAAVAIGECGLDYFRNFSPRAAQRDAFQAQLEIAAECSLPVFLHQRDAHDEFVEILKPMLELVPGGVAHCFTGTENELRVYLDLGLMIGITGWICDERRGNPLRALVKLIPPDRLLLETDSPYLLPRTLTPRPRSRRNEPMHLREVLRVVAASAGRTEADVAAACTANAERFFCLPR